MPNKTIILSIIGVVLAFGALISGCNRDNRTAMNGARSRRGAGRSARPAEVLAAQTYRPPAPHSSIEPSPQFAYASTAATAYVGPVYTAPAEPSPIPLYVPTSQPVFVPQPPELAMVRATMPPLMPPVPQRLAPGARQAPIPELEPIRYHQQPAGRAVRPVAEVMMSQGSRGYNRQEVQRALAPLAQAPAPPAPAPAVGWVASPATAMRRIY